ncbi:MAG: hypothetical protein LAT64_12450 [Phycisphaerales bacterium]|nr:hypothetical protein [Planctomycetota bacterium]MCH8509565.1 hypothetical protein [Phycisphaerales bacterium]
MPQTPGRFGSLGRILGDGENPLRWGLPMGRVAGIRLRVHWLFVLYILSQVIFTLPRHQAGVVFVLPLMASLFVLVLLHEIGHCIACRRAGGEADEIVLWPLGGLAFCRAPHDWRAELRTTLGGPLVNLALLPVFAGALFAATGAWSAVLPNPFDLGGSILDLETAYGSMPWWLIALWSLHTANLVLLGFNLLVPMYPLDAGRVVQCLVWARAGHHRSLWVAAHVGLAVAAGLSVLGLVLMDGKMLLAIGLFGGVVCWMERRRLQFLAGAEPGLDVPPAPVATAEPEEDDPVAGREEVDRILDKIARTGMKSLSAREKRVLKRATERSRDSEGSGPKPDQ